METPSTAPPDLGIYNHSAPLQASLPNALDSALPAPVLRHDGSDLIATVKSQNRLVVHLLHYIPERLSQSIDVVEDAIYHV